MNAGFEIVRPDKTNIVESGLIKCENYVHVMCI